MWYNYSMKIKRCIKCDIEKEITEFSKSPKCQFGVTSICNICFRLINKKFYQKNRKRILKKKNAYYLLHQTKIQKYSKDYREKHIDHYKQLHKNRYQQNKIRINLQANQYQKLRNKTDLSFKILKNLRSRLNQGLHGINKSQRTLELLGCSVKFLRQHLESQFKEGMSWENYGRGWGNNGMKEWQIDHIIPCYKFNLTDPKQQEQCFHYTNLQPMWATINFKKNKY